MTLGAVLKGNWDRLLQMHGYELMLRREQQGTYNPATGSVATTDAAEKIMGFFAADKNTTEEDTRIERGKRKAILSSSRSDGHALTRTPVTGDIILDGTEQFSVTHVRKIRSGATVVGYICKVAE
jgi:hypothetical protein